MKFLLFSVVSLSLIFSPVARGQDTQEAVPVVEGEIVPFTGTLLTNEAAADLITQMHLCTEASTLNFEFELEKEKSVCDLEKSLLQINLDSQREMYENILVSQDRQLEYILKTKNPRLSKEATFIIGVASGVLLTVASAYAISLSAGGN